MIAVSPGLSCARVLPSDPVLAGWVKKLRLQAPHFRHETDDPPMWLGLYLGERLLSAMGYMFFSDGTVLVQMAVCEPTKAGRVALDGVIGLCRSMWTGRRVLWFTELGNRKMKRIFNGVGASPVAAMFEVVA